LQHQKLIKKKRANRETTKVLSGGLFFFTPFGSFSLVLKPIHDYPSIVIFYSTIVLACILMLLI